MTRTSIIRALTLFAVIAPACFAGTVRIVNRASREIRVAVYYFEQNSKTGNLLGRTVVSAGGSWDYSESYRPTAGGMVRTFRFESISGAEYGNANVSWTRGRYTDTVTTEGVADSDPDDDYLFAADEDAGGEGLQVIRCSEK
jgi:hypothetical protein